MFRCTVCAWVVACETMNRIPFRHQKLSFLRNKSVNVLSERAITLRKQHVRQTLNRYHWCCCSNEWMNEQVCEMWRVANERAENINYFISLFLMSTCNLLRSFLKWFFFFFFFSLFAVNPTDVPCPTGMFRCSEGLCIPSLFVCNYQKDCASGEDEFQSCRKYFSSFPFFVFFFSFVFAGGNAIIYRLPTTCHPLSVVPFYF